MANEASYGSDGLRDMKDCVADSVAEAFFTDGLARKKVVAKRVEEGVGGASAAGAHK